MSGAKRRTGYRKQVEADVLHGLPELGALEAVALVARGAGANLFEVLFDSGARTLAALPARFRKLVWLKRGDFVIVRGAEGTTQTARGTAGAVTHSIEHILYADAVRHLQSVGQWPASLDAARAGVCAAAPEGAEDVGAAGGAGAGDDASHPSYAGVGDAGSREQPAARRLQGLRGLPPAGAEEEEESEAEAEEGAGAGAGEGEAAAAAE
jgi:probable RNA-binding protein EIF1AD